MPRGNFVSTNQKHYIDLGGGTSSVWNFCARYSDVVLRGLTWQPRETSAVFSGYVTNNLPYQEQNTASIDSKSVCFVRFTAPTTDPIDHAALRLTPDPTLKTKISGLIFNITTTTTTTTTATTMMMIMMIIIIIMTHARTDLSQFKRFPSLFIFK